MANTVRTVSGATVTYVITGMNTNTVTVTNVVGVQGNAVTLTTSGALGEDTMNALAQLLLQLQNLATVP